MLYKIYVMFFFAFLKIIKNNIGLLIYLLLKEVRNSKLGLWLFQSLDGVTSQKYMTVIRESIIKS